jgi:hypothetical protein
MHHSGERLLHALELLLDTGYASTTSDLATAAERLGEVDSTAKLLEMAAQSLPPHLALGKLRIQMEEESFYRKRQMIAATQGAALGLILPLPPHVLDEFLSVDSVQILSTDGHELPPHLLSRRFSVIRGTRGCREVVAGLDMAVFEARKPNGVYLIAPETADIIDSRILKLEASLVAHLGPHSHPEDVPLEANLANRLVVL